MAIRIGFSKTQTHSNRWDKKSKQKASINNLTNQEQANILKDMIKLVKSPYMY